MKRSSNAPEKKSLGQLRQINIKKTSEDLRNYPIQDQMIVQTVTMIDEVGRVSTRLSGRLKDWISWIVPEAKREISDNTKLVELVSSMSASALIHDIRKRNDSLPAPFGAKVSDEQWQNIQATAQTIYMLFTHKQQLEFQLEGLMKKEAPNLMAIAGAQIGAKLIAIAGSQRRLAMMPASTVQLLGAEKALFRHLKTGAKSPKHGIILQHPLLSQVPRSKRGRVARVLADKLSIAAKIDFFKGKFIGEKLKKELERKLK